MRRLLPVSSSPIPLKLTGMRVSAGKEAIRFLFRVFDVK